MFFIFVIWKVPNDNKFPQKHNCILPRSHVHPAPVKMGLIQKCAYANAVIANITPNFCLLYRLLATVYCLGCVADGWQQAENGDCSRRIAEPGISKHTDPAIIENTTFCADVRVTFPCHFFLCHVHARAQPVTRFSVYKKKKKKNQFGETLTH